MRCENCGKENEDIARFCVSCGKSLKTAADNINNKADEKNKDDESETLNNNGEGLAGSNRTFISDDTGMSPGYQEYQEVNESFEMPRIKKRGGAKAMVIALTVLLVVAAAFGVYRIVDSHSSPGRIVLKYIDAVESGDTKALVKTFPSQYQNMIKDNFSYFDRLSEQYAHDEDIDIDCKIIGKTRLSRDELKMKVDAANSFLASVSGSGKAYGNIHCSKAYSVKFQLSGAIGGVENQSINSVVVYRINGRWFIDPSSL